MTETYSVTLFDDQGRSYIVAQDVQVDADDWPPYLWTDGNMACDCTRSEIIAATIGIPAENIACGVKRYPLRIESSSGRIFDERTP